MGHMSEAKWIDVNDRLPEEAGRYLITVMWSVKLLDGQIRDMVDVELSWFEYGCFGNELAVAWMPLPQPYVWPAEGSTDDPE